MKIINYYLELNQSRNLDIQTMMEQANGDHLLQYSLQIKILQLGSIFRISSKYYNIFFASAGIRYDHHNRFGKVFTYRIAPAYFLKSTSTKFKATYGTGFKSPSLYYLFDPSYGNPNLKPEKSKGWDAGIEQYFFNYKLTLGLTYFNNSFTDLFGYDAGFKTINIDKAETKGIELYLQTLSMYNFSLTSNYTYTLSKDQSVGEVNSGKDLVRRPRNKLAFNLSYSLNKTSLNLEILNVGEREDDDFTISQRVKLKSYTLVNIAGSYKISALLSFTGRIENLFNTKYEEVLYYGTPGLSAYIGAKVNLK